MENATTRQQPDFKTCGSCNATWATWDEFVRDPGVRLLGLQAVPNLPEASVLVFEHGCGSTVSVLTQRLRHLLPAHPEAAGWPSLRGSPECPRHCFTLSDQAPCWNKCAHAHDRDLLTLVKEIHSSRKG